MITGGDLRQSRLDVGYKTFTISPCIKHPSLSPDGCKLAFARMPKIFDPKKEEGIVGTYFLQTINLCELDE